MKYCPGCKSGEFYKDGIVRNKQRYLCKKCCYRFTIEHAAKPPVLKRAALILYLQGVGCVHRRVFRCQPCCCVCFTTENTEGHRGDYCVFSVPSVGHFLGIVNSIEIFEKRNLIQ